MYRGMIAEVIQFPGADGDSIEGYFARPTDAGPFGGVVVIHHMPGFDEWTLEVARRFAQHGFAALAPHLYSREAGDASPDDAAAVVRGQGGAPDSRVVGDVEGAARFLRQQPNSNGKAGIIGFCSGGRQVYLCAAQMKDLDAAVNCWGGNVIQPPDQATERRPVSPFDLTTGISCPMLGIFGNDDANPDQAQVNTIEAELKKQGKTYEFHRYDGAGHGFMGWNNPRSFRPAQTVDAWQKIFDFYGRYLSTPNSAKPGMFV